MRPPDSEGLITNLEFSFWTLSPFSFPKAMYDLPAPSKNCVVTNGKGIRGGASAQVLPKDSCRRGGFFPAGRKDEGSASKVEGHLPRAPPPLRIVKIII